MRKIIVAGNWKMNLKYEEAKELILEINKCDTSSERMKNILIFPSFPYLKPLSEMVTNDRIRIGAQNIAYEKKGAFTGEVSVDMLSSLDINHTLIGHSERRSIFGETNEVLKLKIDQAIEGQLIPIFCCGETLEQRESGQHETIIKQQISESLFHLKKEDFKRVIVAYEPVWAIGTGKTATTQQAEDMHRYIRTLIMEKYGHEISEQTSILYGGSCNAGNSRELFSSPNVDGGLIGGASLKIEEFKRIIASLDE